MRPRLLPLALAAGALLAPAAAAAAPGIHLRPVAGFRGLESPVDVASAPGDARLFAVEQAGRIRVLHRGHLSTFLDIRDLVERRGEQGLLSVAFHPRFTTNGRFFVYYNSRPDGDIRIAEVHARGDRAIRSTLRTVLDIPHRDAQNHNGGQLQFGPDGYLWLGTGDGGIAGDVLAHAQDHASLLGKILRIDVDHGSPYAIPPTNAFATGGGRAEIWSIGMRNPWRFSFDRSSGDLWIGDVGQDAWEEIDRVDRTTFGAGLRNFGWGRFEGHHLFNAARKLTGGRLTWPVAEYSHAVGTTVIGGYVYRGSRVPALRGWYLYADSGRGFVAGLRLSHGRVVARFRGPDVSTPVAFGQGARGELYVVSLGGAILRITR